MMLVFQVSGKNHCFIVVPCCPSTIPMKGVVPLSNPDILPIACVQVSQIVLASCWLRHASCLHGLEESIGSSDSTPPLMDSM